MPSKGICKDCGCRDYLLEDKNRQIVEGEGRCLRCNDLYFWNRSHRDTIAHERRRLIVFVGFCVPGLLYFISSLVDAQYAFAVCSFIFCVLCCTHVYEAFKSIRETRSKLLLLVLRS